MGEIVISVSEGKSLEGRKMSGRRPRGLLVSIIIGSIAVHVVALVIFGIWVIARYFSDPPAEFEVRHPVVAVVKHGGFVKAFAAAAAPGKKQKVGVAYFRVEPHLAIWCYNRRCIGNISKRWRRRLKFRLRI